MKSSGSARFRRVLWVAGGVVAAMSALDATHAWAKPASVARVGRVETPLGTQGTRGAGGNVGIIFNLIDPTRARSDVEVQFGYDRDADGKISDDEFAPATEDRGDPRDTRRNKAPQLFTTSGDIGAAHQFVWKSTIDLHSDRLATLEHRLTAQGREVPDPDNPGSFLFATGPDGDPLFAGVQVRVRAFRVVAGKGRAQKRIYGDWVTSQTFSLNNNNPPTVTIDAVEDNGVSVPTASDEDVLIRWTVHDKDSEDLNANGVLDPALNEDADGDAVLDVEKVGVAFDFHRVAANENPATMTAAQIAALSWLPCTRAKGVGDTDALDARPGVPIPTSGEQAGLPSAPPGVGRSWTFAWDSVADVGTVYAKFVFRARAFDQKRERGDYAYFTTPIQLDNWRIFNPGSAAFPIAPLSGPRVGHTATRVQGATSSTDVLDRGDDKALLGFQSIVVAGGASTVGGGGLDDLDLMTVNTTTAETSTSARIHLQLGTPRAFHTATALDDGRILFIGGFDASGANPLASTEIFDPRTKTVTSGPTLSVARARHSAVKLASGDVAVFGGVGEGTATLGSAEIIEVLPYADQAGAPIPPAGWSVAALPDLAVAQHSSFAALLPDQTVLVSGGIDASGAAVLRAQLLDPTAPGPDASKPQLKAPVFLDVASMLEARKHAAATVLLDGDVLVSGGGGKSSFEIFNWKTRAFEPVGSAASPVAMQVPRAQHVAALLGGGAVLLAGGVDDPDAASPAVTADADVFRIGTRDASGVWSGSFLQVNGSLPQPLRMAKAATVDNGRPFIVGGLDATSATDAVQTYTPVGGVNFPPRARTVLASSLQSWNYGAPIYYRLTDPELDRARVQVQFIDRTPTGDRVWHGCTVQADTIGGDVSESAADLATVATDDQSLPIDPVARNTVGDHVYIWAINRDIPRPALGQTSGPFNVRVVPYGAIRGTAGESLPLDVAYNTKVVPTILPFENYADGLPDAAKAAGEPTPNQGGDVRIWVHLRDLDGPGPHATGDVASCLFEYAVDANSDGQIKADDGEAWFSMTPSGDAVDPVTHAHRSSPNPQTGLTTYYDAAADSDPAFGARPAGKGWTRFDWDSVRDLGAPATPRGDVWVRVTPSDSNEGFVRLVRNVGGEAPRLVLVRHPQTLHLASWTPRHSGNKNATPVNDPIDLRFNGRIDPATVGPATIQIFRGTTTQSQVRGDYVVTNDAATNTSLVSFYPQPQSLNAGSPAYGVNDASTVLFPDGDYSIRIPGYDPAVNPDPLAGTTLRPLGQSVAGGQTSTFRLVFAPPVNPAGTDAAYRFRTASAGVYADDGQAVSNDTQSPADGDALSRDGLSSTGGRPTFTFTQALDPSTTSSPNLTATIAGTTTGGTRTTSPVVPGRWTVTNVQTVSDGAVSSTATLSFVPLTQLPPDSTLQIQWTTGLRAFNGHPVAGGGVSYSTEDYAQTLHSNEVIENFSTSSQNDQTFTTAAWGTDGCVPGALTGATSGFSSGTPAGGPSLTVASGQTVTLTQQTNNYSSVLVQKGGNLVLAATGGPCTLLATGDVTISGTLTFRGANGVNGMHGYTGSYGLWYGPSTVGTRLGGGGKNGGGTGGNSVSVATTQTAYRLAGGAGGNAVSTSGTGGQGGQVGTETNSSYAARYIYGAGGGAGGGNAVSGLGGGRPLTYFSASSGYGAASTPGSATNDAFLSNGVTGGGGGGGGGCVRYTTSYGGAYEGGGGGAGGGGVAIVCNGVFRLTTTGLIDGRGGNGGEGSHYCGAGGAGAGGSLKIVSLGGPTTTAAVFDGVIDLRGGRGGVHGWGNLDQYGYLNATTEKTARYGGDGAPGRLVVVAPNFAAADEVRVYGQLVARQIASVPTTGGSSVLPPNTVFRGSVLTTTYNYGSTSSVRWSTLNIAAGATVDLIGTVPLQIYVDGPVTINGTLRINGNSTSGTATAGALVKNSSGQAIYPTNYAYSTGIASPPTPIVPGMLGNAGGGTGGNEGGGSGSYGREGGNATGPAPGVHNYSSATGFYYSGYYFYCGDSGGSGGANSTDGEDGWAAYAVSAAYYYLGSINDTSGTGSTSQSGQAVPNYPRRLGVATVDPTSLSVANLTSFVGSGGGGANAAGDNYYWGTNAAGMGGQGGGGAGAVAIVSMPTGGNPSTSSVAIGGAIEARGGDGGTPGAAYYWYAYPYGHSGGGGGAGGTVYVAANNVTLGAVPTANPGGGATIDLRGGLGGGYRSQHQTAGLLAYPEYNSSPAFGGSGGYGRLVLDYVDTLNSGRYLANRWGMEQTTIDTSSNTFKALAGTSRFFCPGLAAAGSTARSQWYDLGSITPVLSSFSLAKSANAIVNLRIEGAQSDPNAVGPDGTGQADPGNSSGLFTPSGSPLLTGWRWLRWDMSFVRTTPSSGAPVIIDDVTATYTSDD